MGQKQGSRLPNGYIQYDYIEATAQNVSIDTGVPVSLNLVMQFHLYIARANGDVIIGTKGIVDSNDFRYFLTSRFEYFDIKNGRITYAVGYPPQEVKREIGNFYIKDLISGTIFSTGTAIEDLSISDTIHIGYTKNMQGNKIYFIKIYDSGIPVRSFVPAYSVLDDQYGLFDKVNNVFYGHENFIGGNT